MHLTLSVSVSIRVSQISITPDAKQCTLYLAWRYLLRTLFLRPLLETGPPRYVAIRATQRSSHLQGRGSTFDSFLKYFRPWVMIRPPKSALQSSALPTELILLWSLSTLFHTHPFIQNCPLNKLGPGKSKRYIIAALSHTAPPHCHKYNRKTVSLDKSFHIQADLWSLFVQQDQWKQELLLYHNQNNFLDNTLIAPVKLNRYNNFSLSFCDKTIIRHWH